ncbi:LPS export ABC transporter periplasmic protein LptC [candidate division KSB1 bacterium]|nr:MAG: LPS export ABC transporter periplasmic protein LptC [candidate division KSB1 bacterium]
MKSKKLFAKIILAGLIMGGDLWIGCQHQEKTSLPKAVSSEIPDQEGWNSTLIISSLGKVNAKLQYGHMAKFSDKQIVYFDQGVQLDLYNEQGEHSSRVTAKRGLFNERENFVEAINNVVAHSDSGDVTLFTSRLRWDDRRKKIITNDFVTFVTDKDTLYGYGFESNANLTHWVIKKPSGFSHRPMEVDLERHFAEPVPTKVGSTVVDTFATIDTLTH